MADLLRYCSPEGKTYDGPVPWPGPDNSENAGKEAAGALLGEAPTPPGLGGKALDEQRRRRRVLLNDSGPNRIEANVKHGMSETSGV
jgi:hypothetical protein